MMETAPTTEAVYQGVYALYNNTDAAEQEKASKWLEQLQNSVYSWTIADELLQQKRDLHSCYFAAQTMRNKIQNSFHELPDEAHVSLRDSLIAHISQINSETDPIIVTQLSLALADLALLMSSWQNPILELIEKLSGNPNSLWPLISIITLIPEEINSRILRLGDNRRSEIHKQLESSSKTISELLVASLNTYAQQNPALVLKIIKCYTSWIGIHAIDIQEASNNIIVAQSFNILSNQDADIKMHDAAGDLLCSILQCLEYSNNQPILEAQMFQNVVQLESAYHLSVANEDIDKAMNYCRIFAVMGETFLERMVSTELEQQPHYTIKTLDLILICVGHYDYEVAEITFNLWYRLSEALYQKNNDALTCHFQGYIERLLAALYRLSQMDADHDGLLEDDDSFTDFRRKVSDVIKDVVFIVGSSNCFKQMFLILQEPNATWESSEAALFVMENVAKNILPEENEVVPKVAEAILNLPENTHIAFRYTSIMLLGELCEWIDSHPESLEAVLNFLLYSLNQKNGLAAAAATALTQICTACKSRMTCHLNGLIQIAASLDSYEITNESAINLLKGISLIVGRLPNDQIPHVLQELCSIQIVPLRTLLSANVKVDRYQRSDPSFWLDRLAAIIRHTDPDVRESEVHPCLNVISEIWPILTQIFSKHQSDLRIMERACRCVRYAMRSIGKQAAPLLEPLVKQIVEIYAAHNHSCFLYLGSILVDEFANVSDQCTQGLLDMMQAFMQPTFTRLQEENGLKNHPDTVDDFFRLCSRFLQRSPLAFLQSPIIRPIIQCALLACALDHKDANLSVMKFFHSLLSCGRNHRHHHHHHHHNNNNNSNNNNNNNNNSSSSNTVNNTNHSLENSTNTLKRNLVHELIRIHGEALVNNLIHASLFYLHSYMLSDVADVLLELKEIDEQLFNGFLRMALESLPKKNSGGCVTATTEQLDEFHNAVLTSGTSKSISYALKDFTRLYR